MLIAHIHFHGIIEHSTYVVVQCGIDAGRHILQGGRRIGLEQGKHIVPRETCDPKADGCRRDSMSGDGPEGRPRQQGHVDDHHASLTTGQLGQQGPHLPDMLWPYIAGTFCVVHGEQKLGPLRHQGPEALDKGAGIRAGIAVVAELPQHMCKEQA